MLRHFQCELWARPSTFERLSEGVGMFVCRQRLYHGYLKSEKG
jgi:hypothetical protein